MPSPPPPPPHALTESKAAADANAGRRKHQRLNVRMSAEVRTDRAVFTAMTRDLSEGGAGLVPDRALVDGEEITLGLFLVVDDVEEELPPLWVKARVAWTAEHDHNEHSAGVRFQGLTDEQRRWLRQVLTYLEEHNAPPA